MAAEIQLLESREMLSGVLTDTTPVATTTAIEGNSTGNIVLATFSDAVPPGGLTTTFAVPGASSTTVVDISGGKVVGQYNNVVGPSHGFVYNGSTYTTFDPPGSTNTRVIGVSGGVIAGSYQDSIGSHGYVYDGSVFTTLDPPGSTSINTQVDAISGSSVVGSYQDAQVHTHGFLYNGSTFTTLDVPGSTWTQAFAISSNTIGGYFESADGNGHGFLYNGTSYSTVDFPVAPSQNAFTRITGVSGNNAVGEYSANGTLHAFLFDGSTFTTLDPPGAQWSKAVSVSGNNVVGQYKTGGATYGFLYNGSTFTTINPPGSTTSSAAIDSSGHIVGSYASGFTTYGLQYQLAPVQSDFTPVVDWGGALVGAPTVSVQMVSQSATSSTWEVVGNATYAVKGNYKVAVTVSDGQGSTVQTSNESVAVLSLDGQYFITEPGNPAPFPPLPLASITHTGSQLTLNGLTTTTATVASSTQLLVGGTDTATFGNGSITFTSGAFAGQVWTKLILPTDFTNPQGAAVHVTQNGTDVIFTDALGQTSTGKWTSADELSAFNETVAVSTGSLIWDDGTVWRENTALGGVKNGAGTISLTTVSTGLQVVDYLTGDSQSAAYVLATGTTTIAIIDKLGEISLAKFINSTQATDARYPGDVATFVGGMILWQSGEVWTYSPHRGGPIIIPIVPPPPPLSSPPIETNYVAPNGVATTLVQNKTNTVVFVDSRGVMSLGTLINSTQAVDGQYPNDMATIGANTSGMGTVTWGDGTVWKQSSNPTINVVATDQNGVTLHMHLVNPSTIVELDGPLQGVSGTRVNNEIVWANGDVWSGFDNDALDAFFFLGSHDPAVFVTAF